MFLKMPALESTTITLRTKHHQAQNSSVAAWNKMTDLYTKHLSDIISPALQIIEKNRSYITGVKQQDAQELNSLGQKVSTFILHLPPPPSSKFSMSKISVLKESDSYPSAYHTQPGIQRARQ